MEITLFHSCLHILNFNYFLRTYPLPPSYIQYVTSTFEDLIRESLSDPAGIFLVGLGLAKGISSKLFGRSPNFRSANLYVPALYLSSLAHSSHLISRIMPKYLMNVLLDLPKITEMLYCGSVTDIDIALLQGSLSRRD